MIMVCYVTDYLDSQTWSLLYYINALHFELLLKCIVRMIDTQTINCKHSFGCILINCFSFVEFSYNL